jgi:hypothetical protein
VFYQLINEQLNEGEFRDFVEKEVIKNLKAQINNFFKLAILQQNITAKDLYFYFFRKIYNICKG